MGFANQRAAVVTDFGADPNNPSWPIVRDAMRRLNGFIGGPVIAGGDADPERQFFGVGPQLQDFTGAAARPSTGVVFRNGDVPNIGTPIAEGPETDPVRRIFADRMRRRAAL